MIDAELLHMAAEEVSKQDEPTDAGFTEDAVDRFIDESTFKALTEDAGEVEIAMRRGSLAYGLAVGVEAARMEEPE